MIGPVFGRVGEPLRLNGYADDFDKEISAVQFSLNDGQDWTEYETPDADGERLLRWSFLFTPPEAGTYTMLVRSKNCEGEVSPTPARVDLVVAHNILEGRGVSDGS